MYIFKKPKLPAVPYYISLPMELYYEILKYCTTKSLLQFRLVSKSTMAIANSLLCKSLLVPFIDLSIKTRTLEIEYNSAQDTQRPLLEHYRGFLNPPTLNDDLTEVVWYTNVREELKVVLECLCRLKGGVMLPDNERMHWPEIKNMLKKSDFRLWISSLLTNVEFIKILDTKKVEQIIRVDPLITYERLREVSTAGYRLLIVVAACLQFSSISYELTGKQEKFETSIFLQKRMAQFLDSITLKL